MRIAVLVSGSGTILQAIVAAGIAPAAVISDRSCRALDLAADHGADVLLLDRRQWGGYGSEFRRDDYTDRLVEELDSRGVGLVVMAGFGTVLGQSAHTRYPNRILNTHPALLPAHPGWHAVADALADGATVSGCTVHLAGLVMDTGPILAQIEVPVIDDDTEDSLHERIKEAERVVYPATIARVAAALEHGVDPAGLAPEIRRLPSQIRSDVAPRVAAYVDVIGSVAVEDSPEVEMRRSADTNGASGPVSQSIGRTSMPGLSNMEGVGR